MHHSSFPVNMVLGGQEGFLFWKPAGLSIMRWHVESVGDVAGPSNLTLLGDTKSFSHRF